MRNREEGKVLESAAPSSKVEGRGWEQNKKRGWNEGRRGNPERPLVES